MYYEIITVQCSVISKDYINYLGIPYDMNNGTSSYCCHIIHVYIY